jgi:hypothetical protein
MDRLYHKIAGWLGLVTAILSLAAVCVSTGWYLKQLDTVSKNLDSVQGKVDTHETKIAVLENTATYVKDALDKINGKLDNMFKTGYNAAKQAYDAPANKGVKYDADSMADHNVSR